ncbi:MAG: YcaO-like family protein [Blautia sp.]|jgi:YcaO-like protein with predicted kinase domain
MSRQQELHYKDRRPQETVEYLQNILKELGIPVEEQEIPRSSADTYSLRINIKGTGLGSNGKGVSEIYAKASAYAEFLERLQNDILMIMAKYPKNGRAFRQFPDEIHMSSGEIARSENAMMDWFFEARGMKDASVKEREAFIRKNCKVEYYLYGTENSYETRPFYSVKTKKVEYLPYFLYMGHYGSNGMSAGNTPQEALVQGLSEIIERHVQEKIMMERPSLPDIPDTYIQNYPYIWERVQKLRNISGIRVYMKDCSFGGKYPVAALLVVDMNTGCYGIKLGCHPDYGVAMERSITEATQGNDISAYARRSVLDFENNGLTSIVNIYNSYKMGFGVYPYEMFGRKSSWEFQPVKDVSEMSNQEILDDMLNSFLKEGYDVLIRDVSYTGFPSFHILIPGMSEINRNTTERYMRAANTKAYLIPYLNYPETIDQRIAKLLRGILDYFSDSQIENALPRIYCVYPDFDFPGEEMGSGWLYMSAMCCYYLGEYREALQRIKGLIDMSQCMAEGKTAFYRAVYYYISARNQKLSHEDTLMYLKDFFEENLAEDVAGRLENPEKVFVRQYPRFDYLGKDKGGEPLQGEYITWLGIKEKMLQYMERHPLSQEKVGEYLLRQE